MGTIRDKNFNVKKNLIHAMKISLAAIVATIIGQMGDLTESAIKRYIGIKDFGNVFPGHGGMIDRFDSTIFVAPIVFMYFCLLI